MGASTRKWNVERVQGATTEVFGMVTRHCIVKVDPAPSGHYNRPSCRPRHAGPSSDFAICSMDISDISQMKMKISQISGRYRKTICYALMIKVVVSRNFQTAEIILIVQRMDLGVPHNWGVGNSKRTGG